MIVAEESSEKKETQANQKNQTKSASVQNTNKQNSEEKAEKENLDKNFEKELESFFKITPDNSVSDNLAGLQETKKTTVGSLLSSSLELLNWSYQKLPSLETLKSYIPAISITFSQYPPGLNKSKNDPLELESFFKIQDQTEKNKDEADVIRNNNTCVEDNNKNLKNLNPYFQISFNELKLIREIGRGSQGIIYHVKWRNTSVALKQMLDARASEKVHNAFLAEMQIMAQIRHPHIVQFLGIVDEPTKGLAIVMEYIPGGTLSALLKNNQINITWKCRCHLALGIASAIAFLHPETLHRDIKPDNIFVTQDWCTKLGDFGLSIVVAGEKKAGFNTAVGTPLYMAPEVLKGEQCSTASDVFSVGMVFWGIASRAEPHAEINSIPALYAKLLAHKREDIPSETPELYKNLILHCWKTVAAERPKAATVLETLEKLEEEFKFKIKQ